MSVLSPLILPDSVGARDYAIPADLVSAEYADRYDRDVLWYDAIWHKGRVILTCPKLFNLEALVRRARFTLDGEPAGRLRIAHHPRNDTIILRAACPPKRIGFAVDGFETEVALSDTALDEFAGLNTAMSISRNNDLRWLADYVAYHRHHHDLQAMLFFDNGSDRYGPDDIAATLTESGLAHFRVVSVPLKYGPMGPRGYRHGSKFLRTGLLNIARVRFLRRARAVLNTDLDELVLPGKHTVFDAALRHPLGLVSMWGEWRYPAPGGQPPYCHADHVYRSKTPPRPSAKYCINPRGALRWVGWDVHKPDFIAIDKFLRHKDLRFAHCRMVTTNWKSNARFDDRDDLVIDPDLQAALGAVFGAQG